MARAVGQTVLPGARRPEPAQLREWIYAGQTLYDLARPSIIGALVVFIVGLLLAVPKDQARARARRHGRRLKGPELVSARRFNRRMRADGITFAQENYAAGAVRWRSSRTNV